MVCAYASRYPREIAGLVLVDPPAASQWRAPTTRRFACSGAVFISPGLAAFWRDSAWCERAGRWWRVARQVRRARF